MDLLFCNMFVMCFEICSYFFCEFVGTWVYIDLAIITLAAAAAHRPCRPAAHWPSALAGPAGAPLPAAAASVVFYSKLQSALCCISFYIDST